jgi:hypothetical protein
LQEWERVSAQLLDHLDKNHTGWRGQIVRHFETGEVVG